MVVIVPIVWMPYHGSGNNVQIPLEYEFVILIACVILTLAFAFAIKSIMDDLYWSKLEMGFMGTIFVISFGMTVYVVLDILMTMGII